MNCDATGSRFIEVQCFSDITDWFEMEVSKSVKWAKSEKYFVKRVQSYIH